MIQMDHLSIKELETVKVKDDFFAEPKDVYAATPSNINILVERINEMTSAINALREENIAINQQLRLARMKKFT